MLNVKDSFGWTPLDVAISRGKLDMAQFLFEMGGRPNLEIYNCDGKEQIPPTHYTAWSRHPNIPKFLKWVFKERILPLCVINIKDQNGLTPLDWSIEGGETRSLLQRFLIDFVFLIIHRVKRDYQCVLRRLPDELLDMVVDEVAARFHMEVVWKY